MRAELFLATYSNVKFGLSRSEVVELADTFDLLSGQSSVTRGRLFERICFLGSIRHFRSHMKQKPPVLVIHPRQCLLKWAKLGVPFFVVRLTV